ncbi:protein JASON-like [Bidens hawaiensis]|uniref:protein JASON-like n=1 Tax=Bidens hawaiensis TaxID=980011 RepID=UPI0040490722
MGCFFGCFRVRDDRRTPIHLLSQPKDPVVSSARNPLSSLLLFDGTYRDQLSDKDRKHSVAGSAASDINLQELKAEAKFLKDCGTLLHTPADIRNNEKLIYSKSQNGDTDSSTYHSWLQDAGIEKVKLEKQPDSQPVKLFEEWENGSYTSSHSPDSCVTGHSLERVNSSSAQKVKHNLENTDVHADLAKCRNKFVRFDCNIEASPYSLNSSSSEVTCQESKPSGYPSDYSFSKPSPYPTPLTLTNDMQTPGTVFSSFLHNKEYQKNPRVRSQPVSPVLTPVENAAQLKKLVDESFSSDCYSAQSEEHFENGESTAGKELNVDTSLSSWLPPKQKTNQVGNNRSFTGRTPVDRPILGMVAAHWNADEVVDSPPKWWDGNGIPNSTNKYKEDQKVSWHATPFEERLEKALSEDRLIAERKQLGTRPLRHADLNEKEEHEASSHFEPGLIMTA